MTKQVSLPVNEKIKKLPFLELLLVIFFLWYYLLPSASNSVPFMLALGVGILYIVYVILMCGPSPKAFTTLLKLLFVVLFVALCYYVFTVTKTVSDRVENYELKRFISKFQQLFFTALPLLFTYRVFLKGTKKQKLFLLLFAAVMILYVIAQSLEELATNATASRVWGEFAEMSEKNVGTYNFVYAVAIALPAVFALAQYVKKWPIKLLLFALFVLGIVFLVQAQYTISIIITVVLCFASLLLGAKRLVTKAVVVAVCPLLFILLPDILTFVATHIVGESAGIRLLEIAEYFTGEAVGYNLSGRLTLYQQTLKNFFAHPLFGNATVDYDGHATFLTVLADLGLFGGIPFYYLYFSMRKHIGLLLDKNKVMVRCFMFSFLAVILTGFLNPIHAALPLPMVAWFVIPLAVGVLLNETEKDDGKMEE